VSGTPGLTELPGFAALSSTTKEYDVSNLAILVTPHILRRRHNELRGPVIPLPHHSLNHLLMLVQLSGLFAIKMNRLTEVRATKFLLPQLELAPQKVHPIGPRRHLRDFSEANMAGKLLVLTTLLFLLTSCRQEQLSLPVAHAAQPRRPFRDTASSPGNPAGLPARTCYSYILLRPRDQRATAVQARLKKADDDGRLRLAHGHSGPDGRPRQYPVPAVSRGLAGRAGVLRIASARWSRITSPRLMFRTTCATRDLPRSGYRLGA
jgi:hypothetical protein